MKKNILITGGLGLLGKSLVQFLGEKKFKIFVLDKSKNKKRNKLVNKKNVNIVYGDFRNKNLLKKNY